MEQFFHFTWMIIQSIPFFLVHPFFWLVVLLVVLQYRRTISMEKKLLGMAKNNIWQQTIYSVLAGLVGGLFASLFILGFGLSLDRLGIIWLWPVALILVLVHPRLLCFSYAGGIVGLIVLIARPIASYAPHLVEQFPFLRSLLDISLPGLLLLIAVLHLTESLLIYWSGHWGHTPIFLKTPHGKVVGGFSMQRFWPLPIIGLISTIVPESSPLLQGTIAMPDWWPLFESALEPGSAEKLVYYMFPVVAGLGYSDLAISRKPRQKSILTARNLALYSGILLLLALFALYFPPALLLGVLFAPFGHEYIVHLGNKNEMNSKPYYDQPPAGVRVLMTIPGSLADRAGIRENDIISKVNGVEVNSAGELWRQLWDSYFLSHLEILREEKISSIVLRQEPGRRSNLGLVLVPEQGSGTYVELRKGAYGQKLKQVWKRLTERKY